MNEPDVNLPRYFTVRELSRRFRQSEATTRSQIRAGKLEAIKVGRQHLVSEDALRRFIEARQRR